MKDLDHFKTIKYPSKGLYKTKGSKFLSFAYHVKTETEIKEKVRYLKKEYHDARHHCYAYALGNSQQIIRANDDGEPSNTAGKPILGQIYSNGLTNVLIVVIRYFGGTLLGVSGLITAYKTAAEDALNNAEIVVKIINDKVKVSFGYNEMNLVMRILKNPEIEILKQDFLESCTVLFSVRKTLSTKFIQKLNSQKNVEASIA